MSEYKRFDCFMHVERVQSEHSYFHITECSLSRITQRLFYERAQQTTIDESKVQIVHVPHTAFANFPERKDGQVTLVCLISYHPGISFELRDRSLGEMEDVNLTKEHLQMPSDEDYKLIQYYAKGNNGHLDDEEIKRLEQAAAPAVDYLSALRKRGCTRVEFFFDNSPRFRVYEPEIAQTEAQMAQMSLVD